MMMKRTTRIAAVFASIAVVLGAAGMSVAAYAEAPPVVAPSYSPPPGSDPASTPAPLQLTLPDNGCYLGPISLGRHCTIAASADSSTSWGLGYKLTLNYGAVPDDVQHNDGGVTFSGPEFTKVTVEYQIPWTFAAKDAQPQNPTATQIETYVADASDGTITFPVLASDVFADDVAAGYGFYNVWYQFSGAGSDGRVWSSTWTSAQITPTDDAAVTDPNVAATQVADNAIDLTAGGSAPVADSGSNSVSGYKVSVYRNGAEVGTQVLDPGQATTTTVTPAARIVGASVKKPAAAKVSDLFSNLKAGSYRFYVSAFDGHGNSHILRTRSITVKAAKLAAAKNIKVSNGKKLNVAWGAVKGKLSTYTVQVIRRGNVVEAAKVKASSHTVRLKKLSRGTYAIRITAKDKSGHTSIAQRTLTIKVTAKA